MTIPKLTSAGGVRRCFSIWALFGLLTASVGNFGCESGGPDIGEGGDGDADGDADGDSDADSDSDSDSDDTDSTSGGTDDSDTVNPCLSDNPPDNCQMVPSGPACGDGNLDVEELGEECDDGNTLPGDGCTGICKVEPFWTCEKPGEPCELQIVCGNGKLEAGEECDDGNNTDDDGCSGACEQSPNFRCPVPGDACERIAFCGDGRINGDENCEDGNTDPDDGCSDECKVEPGFVCPVPGEPCGPGPRCGDSILSIGIDEQCDDGNVTAGDGCDESCQIESGFVCPAPGEVCKDTTVCGDGRVTGKETCDDANEDPNDGCDACVLQPGYECPFPGAKCLADCGDGILMPELGEECDDGNEESNDGCTPTCEWEDGFVCTGTPPNYSCRATICGDKIIEGTEGCDDGNNNMGDGCTPRCMLEPICEGGACRSTCGDGLVLESMNEACDDGNVNDGDGCSSDCQVEDGFECKQPPLGESMEVPIVFRDFGYNHPDFENGVVGQTEGNPGMVESVLDDEGKPVYTGLVNNAHVASAASFSEWFRDSAASNTKAEVLTLYNNGNGGFVNRWGGDGEPFAYYSDAVWCGQGGGTECDQYPACVAGAVDAAGNSIEELYETNGVCLDPCTYWGNGNTSACMVLATYMDGNPAFFPVDDMESADRGVVAKIPPPYADSWPFEDPVLGEEGPTHNFSFTSEVRYWFAYHTDQEYTLEFLGDDDVWVFVNNRLAVDLGGIHTPVEGTLSLTTAADGAAFAMEDGEVYEVVVFQAERQTDCSSYKLTLSGFNASESDCGPICGDAVMSPGEQCDSGYDGNTGEYGKCSPDCTRGPYCGDGIVQEEFEECDNGLNIDVYGTASTGCAPGCVRPATCGDGDVQAEFGEVCDDGVNDGSYDGCSATCLGSPWCGDAQVSTGIDPKTGYPYEECDDGLNDGSYGNCAPGCVLGPRCGDGVIQEEWGEECDGSSDCSPTCRLLGYCGDAQVNTEINPETGAPYEQCDDGVNDGGFGECAPECRWGPYCGDGAVESSLKENGEPYELCDDTINDGGYGECAPGCVLGPRCGDGLVQPAYEECDEGEELNGTTGVYCSSACKKIIVIPI